ncbi:31838_t:CDS:2, partial [Gigaspora margarita]
LVFNTLVIYLLLYYDSSSKLTNKNLNLNLLILLINEQSSDSIINNEQSLNSVINTSESLSSIPIPESAEYDNRIRRHCRYSGCPWVINAICPKKTGIINITSLYLEHGDHPFDPLTKKFSLTYRTLTEPMLADIEFWTTKGNLSMRTQHQLLEAKYENVFFLPQDLSNAIQRVKAKQNVDCETAILINYFIEHKAEDIQ